MPEEIERGTWIPEEIFEKQMVGEIYRNTRRASKNKTDGVADDIVFSTYISIILNPFVKENLTNIKYAEYLGTKWKITDLEIQYPRLLLTLGGVWNG